MNYKAILFDMDGLVFDSERIMYDAYRNYCESQQLPCDFNIYALLLGKTSAEGRRILANATNGSIDYDQFIQYATMYKKRFIMAHGLPVKKGFYQLISYIERHQLLKGLVSSSDASVVQTNLEATSLFKLFDVVISGDQLAQSKPAPDIYLRAAMLLGVQPKDCLVLEDSENGIKAGVNAHMDVICIPDLVNHPQSILNLCKAVVSSLDQVIRYL